MAHSPRPSIHQRLDRIEWMLNQLFRMLRYSQHKDNIIMAAIDDLEAEVARNTAVDESAVLAINGLYKMLDEAIASGNPARIQAALDTMKASSDSLAAAIAHGTPADPVPDPAPVPDPVP